MSNDNTAYIRSLRTFAASHGEFAFAHLCTAALGGDESAIARLNGPFLKLGQLRLVGSPSYVEAKLEIIRSIDTTRPDGNIARTLIDP